MIDERFIILAVVADLIGSGGYIIDTIKGSTKPNRVSWLLWTLIPAVTVAGMIEEKADKTALILTITFTIIPLLIFIASFINKEAFWKITKFDWLCGAFSLIGLAGWLLTGDGNLAIVFSIIADFLALLPTLKKALKAPDTESWLIYLLGTLAAFITLLTIQTWNFASVVFTVYLMLVCLLMFLVVRFQIGPRLRLKRL